MKIETIRHRSSATWSGDALTPRYLLDTNICIYLRRSRPVEVTRRFVSLEPGEAAMSVVTFGELLVGAAKSQEIEAATRRLFAFAEIVPLLDLPGTSAQHYARVRAELERSGNTIGNNDLWIAAHALAENLIVVTNNEREFRRVEGLRIENWVAAER